MSMGPESSGPADRDVERVAVMRFIEMKSLESSASAIGLIILKTAIDSTMKEIVVFIEASYAIKT